MPRTFVIGDIHGDVDTLNTLIDALSLKKGDSLVFLGDLIDRGPNSKGVLDRVIELSKDYDCHFIMGNHEEFMIRALNGDEVFEKIWLKHGGRQTLKSYGVDTVEDLKRALPEAHKKFLSELNEYIETDTHIFTHANWEADTPPSEQKMSYLRYIFLSNARPDPKLDKTVVVGHSALLSGTPAIKGNILCVDTLEYGWLTAYDVNNGGFVQASPKGEVRHLEKADAYAEHKHVPERFRRKKHLERKP